MTEQGELEGGKVQQSDAKKSEKRKKRRRGSGQLTAPDENKPQATPSPDSGTVNTGQGTQTNQAGGQAGGSGSNVNTNKNR